MKIQLQNAARRRQGGSATITFTILLSIMLILATAETRALIQLRQEQSLLEQRQMQRLQHAANPSDTTNTVVPAAPRNQ